MLLRNLARPECNIYVTVATTSSSFSEPISLWTVSISSYRLVVMAFDFCVVFGGGFSTVCILCFLCLMDDDCSELVCNVNVPAAYLCETRYTFPVNCLTRCGIGM